MKYLHQFIKKDEKYYDSEEKDLEINYYFYECEDDILKTKIRKKKKNPIQPNRKINHKK